MDELMDILADLRPDVTFEGNDKLIDNGDLDSFDVVTLVGELNDAFSIDIPVEQIIPENFNSVEQMRALIERLQDED